MIKKKKKKKKKTPDLTERGKSNVRADGPIIRVLTVLFEDDLMLNWRFHVLGGLVCE